MKWFQRWQNHASFVGTFKIQLKKTIQYRKGLKDSKTLHPLWGHSNPNWKTQFIIEMITKMKDRYILCWGIQSLTDRTLHLCSDNTNSSEKAVQYPTDFKDDRTLHRLWGHSNSNWKRQFSTEMISKITELYILWAEIQTPTKKDSFVLKWLQRWQKLTSFVGIFQFPTEEDSLVLK